MCSGRYWFRQACGYEGLPTFLAQWRKKKAKLEGYMGIMLQLIVMAHIKLEIVSRVDSIPKLVVQASQDYESLSWMRYVQMFRQAAPMVNKK